MLGGKIIPRIRLTSAKDLVEVEAELGKNNNFIIGLYWQNNIQKSHFALHNDLITFNVNKSDTKSYFC